MLNASKLLKWAHYMVLALQPHNDAYSSVNSDLCGGGNVKIKEDACLLEFVVDFAR